MCRRCKQLEIELEREKTEAGFSFVLNLVQMVTIVVLFLLCLAGTASAADIGCGRDTDRSGTVDNLCPGDDTDFDGYTVAQGDCDDEDWEIFPGAMSTKGLSAGHYRVCKASGAGWTADTTSSVTPYCPSGDYTTTAGKSATSCKYISISSGNDSNDGSYSSPWQHLDKIRASNPTDGTAYIIMPGTYDEYRMDNGSNCTEAGNSCSQISIDNRDCATVGCWIVGYPGTRPVLSPNIPTATQYLTPVKINESGGWRVWNLEVTGEGVGNSISLVYNADGADVALNYVHGRLLLSDNNNAGIYVNASTTGDWDIHHNHVSDMQPASGTSQEPMMLVFYGGVGFQVGYNVLIGNATSGNGGIMNKKGYYGSTGTVIGNYVKNIGNATLTSFGVQFSEGGTITRNLFKDCTGEASTGIDLPGNASFPGFTGPVEVTYNTVENCRILIHVEPERECDTSNSCIENSCTNGPIDDVIINNNVLVSNMSGSQNSSWDALMIGQYKSDPIYGDFVTGGLLQMSANCWYNTNAVAMYFTLFGDNGGNSSCGNAGTLGDRYTSFSAWNAAGFETGSYNENPTLSAISQATSTNCAARGYMTGEEEEPDPDPDPEPTATSAPLSARAIRRIH